MTTHLRVITLAAILLLSSGAVVCSSTNGPYVRGFVSEPDGRGTVGILSSCILTLVICLWTCLHLNIPPPTVTYFQILRRKLRWMLIGAIAPEIMASTAFGQYLCVKDQVRKINSISELFSQHGDKWTLTDGFYANMGGFILLIPDQPSMTINTSQLVLLAKHNLISFPPSSLRTIEDKSKADGITKGLACFQASWLVISCTARVIQHLPLTTLELSTIAYVFLTIIIFASLWYKPLDVRMPTTITLLPNASESVLKSLVCRRTVGIDEEKDFSSEYYLIPYRRHKHNSDEDRILPRSFVIAPVLGVLYGIWHLLAWNFFFATHAELLLWRICTIVTTISLPLLFGVVGLDEYCNEEGINDHGLCYVLFIIFASLYALARMAMIAEVFTGLRMLPAGAFDTVQWTNFVPHL